MFFNDLLVSTLKRGVCAILILYVGFLAACAKEPYIAKPIQPADVTAKIGNKNPLSPQFVEFCEKQGYPKAQLPFKDWGIDELTLSALYFHPSLDIAKAQLGVAKASLENNRSKQPPTLNAAIAHSNRANKDIRPFSYGFNVEIPIETNNKREIRLEEAEHLAETARLDVAETAWKLRSQLSKDLLDYHHLMQQAALQQAAVNRQQQYVHLIEKRVKLGLASSIDLASAQGALLKAQTDLVSLESARPNLAARLASDAGLSVSQFEQIPIRPLELDNHLKKAQTFFSDPNKTASMQASALLNRIDIRRSLAKYAAAESKIKLEVAKQTPDIALAPGYLFEYGDKIWSLGFASLLNLLNKNPTYIREAEALRAVEGAQFEALQTQVISEVAQTRIAYQTALNDFEQAKIKEAQQTVLLRKTRKQFDAGLIDRLEMTQAELQSDAFSTEILHHQFAILRAANMIEDVMQRSIYTSLFDETSAE